MKYFIFFLFFSTGLVADSACSDLKDDCEYYSCISSIKNCPSSSYPENFGRKYCLRYADRSTGFSDKGKLWIENVKRCLIQDMEKFEVKLSCSQLKSRAFKGHVPCYVASGFCQLSIHDKREVIRTIWPSIRNVYILANGINILRACAPIRGMKSSSL